jgi:hypothetical protein
MKHLIQSRDTTLCKRLRPGVSLDEKTRSLLIDRMSYTELPHGDTLVSDPADTDCKKCMDEKIAMDDHERWNAQFFVADENGNLNIARTGFIDPEPINEGA